MAAAIVQGSAYLQLSMPSNYGWCTAWYGNMKYYEIKCEIKWNDENNQYAAQAGLWIDDDLADVGKVGGKSVRLCRFIVQTVQVSGCSCNIDYNGQA